MYKQQREAIGLLGIGTFLEYFDLMLYVHLVFFLNELFFPKGDLFFEKFYLSFAFCSTFVFRPVGALIFGWIGDNIGRKATVIITTIMMSLSCVIIASLPTYTQIGIIASWIVTIARIMQGMAAMGERIGAEIFISEIITAPVQYPAVVAIAIFSALGGVVALGCASLFLSVDFNWRNLFWVGALVGIIGIFARTRLRETTDFSDAKRRIVRILKSTNQPQSLLSKNPIFNEKTKPKTFFALLSIYSAWPVFFYFTYIYCGEILKNSFGFTTHQIITQNCIVGCVELIGYIFLAYISYYVNPLNILKVKIVVFSPFCLIIPYLLDIIHTSNQLLMLQSFIISCCFSCTPALPIFLKYLPIFQKFTVASITYSTSRAIIYFITSFSFVYLDSISRWMLLVVILPINIGYVLGVRYFENLETITNKSHPHKG